MSEWVLVPLDPTEAMLDRGASEEGWKRMLAARPPIPHDVWEAMWKRAYVALWTDGEYNGVDAALRAALGNPMVEEDET